ncbi:MAG: CAP domain-containing protein [Friedmanniella sp.]|jgi:pathogenesis-related protein 1|nr:CAP domain-containing protein [Geodermatophilus sp.]
MNKAAKAAGAIGVSAAVVLGLPGTASAGLNTGEKDAFVAQHNEYRAEVGTPQLAWDDTVAATAQAYADHLLPTVQSQGLVHDPNTPYGENLYYAWASGGGATAPDPLNAMASWYAEKALYDANPEPVANPVQGWGHYSQMVWRDTQRVGCGAASGFQNGQWDTVVVCRYDPAGNIIGQKPY